ncbi:MAG TPA: MFS transporter, partial [Burkholderiales bacterium]|nr:MFS transporter [Burkholderiales bacterium]
MLAFLSAAFVWNYGLGLTYVMVPLYAHSQGLSGAEIGILFSLPVLGQMAVNLVGGAYTDRLGGRRIMLLSAGLMALAGLGFIAARGFWMLVGGQLLMVLSRATFWPAAWSSASELPGHRGAQLGRLNATTNLGQILGTGSAGFLLGWLGYATSFLALAAIGLSAAALVLGARTAGDRRQATRHAFVHFRPLLRLPVIYFAVLCAYLSALPFSLSTSFYPLLLLHYGFSADA